MNRHEGTDIQTGNWGQLCQLVSEMFAFTFQVFVTKPFLTIFLHSHLWCEGGSVYRCHLCEQVWGFVNKISWGAARTYLYATDHTGPLPTPKSGHWFWQPAILLGPAGDLKWFEMRVNFMFAIIKLLSQPLSFLSFCSSSEALGSRCQECLSLQLILMQVTAGSHMVRSVLLGPVDNGDMMTRNLHLSYPEGHIPHLQKVFPHAKYCFCGHIFYPFSHNSIQSTLYYVKEKQFSSHGDPFSRGDSDFWVFP